MPRPAAFLFLAVLLGGAVASAQDALEAAAANPPADGLLVIRIVADSNAARSGLKVGDVLTRYGAVDLEEETDLAEHTRGSEGRARVEVVLFRGMQQQRLNVRGGRLGLDFAPVRRGVAVTRPAAQAFTPAWDRLPTGETFLALEMSERKVGFERRTVTLEGDRIQLERVIRYRIGDFNDSLRFRYTFTRGAVPVLQRMQATIQDRDLYDLKREGDRLVGKSGGKTVQLNLPETALPLRAVPLLAQVMPEKGACAHLLPLDELSLELLPRHELRAAGSEGGMALYELSRFGQIIERMGMRGGRPASGEYAGGDLEAGPRDEVLSDLPRGVSTRF